MKLERCEVKRFGKLKNFKAEFAPGLNLVKGPNEAGKSTLVEALGAGLFEDPQSPSREWQEKASWGSDKKFEVSLELASGTERWRLCKDFEKGEVKLEKADSAEKWNELSEVDEVLASRMGLGKKDLHLATSFIRQGELSLVSENPEAWRERLEEGLTGGREEVLAAGVAEKLAARIAYLGEEGELGSARQYKKEIEYQLSLVSEEVKSLLANRTDLAEIEKAFAEVTRQAKGLKKRMEEAGRPAPTSGELVLLEEKFQDLSARLQEIEESEKTVKTLREEAALESDVSREDIARLDEIEGRLRFLELEHGETQPAGSEPPRFPTPLPFLAGLGASIACLIAALLSSKLWWGGVAAGLVWAGKSGLAFLQKIREAARREWEYKNSQGKKEVVIGEVEKLRRDQNELLARYRVTSAASLRGRCESSRERARKISEATLRYESLLGGRSRGELEGELAAALPRLTELQKEPAPKHDSEELEVLGEKLAALEEERRNFETARNAIARHLQQTEDGIELKVALEERVEYENRRIAGLEHKQKVYLKTLELWNEASKKAMVEAADVLDVEVSKHLSQISDWRYSRVRFNRENLSFEVYSEEKKDFVNPHRVLSAGVRDQLYLATRLSLLKFIFPEQKPILILDDPFGNFDPARRQKAGELLVKLASEYQILLLTSQDYFDHLAAAKIEL